MVKGISLFIILLVCGSQTYAQNVNITGTVTTADGQPAQAVTISVKGGTKGAVTGANGNYTIKNIKPGSYTLIASLIGLESQEQQVNVVAGQQAVVNFVLKENSSQLQEVTISSRNTNKVNAMVAKTPLKNLENPQAYHVVSLETIKQQGIVNFDDVMRNVPGIARTWESTGRAGDGAAYFALRGFEAQPSLYNGLPGFTSGNLDLADVQEVQVLKGPSGTLFGANFVGYGGIINVITKKPYFSTGGEVAFTAGSFGLNRISADVNTPLSKTEKVALRVNTAYSTENSFQDAGYRKSFFLAPAITYQANDKLTFNFMAEILQEERSVAPVFFNTNRADPLTQRNIAELNLDPKKSFTSNDLPIKNPRYTMQGEMTYKFNDHWTSQTAISRGSVKADGYYGYIYGNAAGTNVFEQYIHKENQTSNTIDIQQNFNGDVELGGMRHRLLLGLDYFNRNIIDNGTGYGMMRLVTPQGDVSYPDGALPVYLTRASVDSLLAGTGNSQSNVSTSTYAAYISDVITVAPGLNVLASLRADGLVDHGEMGDPTDNFRQFKLSPKFGLIYQPLIDRLSIFANYQNSFLNVGPQQVFDQDGETNPRVKTFTPEHANQLEFGAKTNLFSDKLSATVSYYDIKVANRVTPLVENPFDYDQRGKVRSRGFEIDINAYPAPGWSLLAGYAHNRIQNTSSNGTDFYTENGRAPGGQGPQDMVNLWSNYKIQRGSLKDFGFGIGGNYAGVYKVIDNSVTGVFELPSYTLLNASLFYDSDRYRITLNGNNLTNKQYYTGYWSVNPQRPVNYTASFAYRF
ncbi:TonB-dependent receptor [Mucilaginibacter sp. JRF]|nr:TonB-dependent receptor [Mucilaginibacter sp. JRF]